MITVRQATIFDLDALVPLFDAYRQFYRKPSDPDLARRFLRDRFEHSQSVIFIAFEDAHTAAGFTQLYPSFSSGAAARIFILNDLFVEAGFRRWGVGARLLQEAATEVTNAPAQALYESCGWTRQTDFHVYNLSLGG